MATKSTRLSLVGLPVEVLTMIFGFVPNPNDFTGAALSCQYLYKVILRNEHAICNHMLKSQFTNEQISIVVARYVAENVPWRQILHTDLFHHSQQAGYEGKIVEFCEQYIGRPGVTPRLPQQYVTFELAIKLLKFHDIVRRIATKFSHAVGGTAYEPSAMSHEFYRGQGAKPNPRWDIPVTETERWRIEKAIYIIDMVAHLFPLKIRDPRRNAFNGHGDDDTFFNLFWLYFAPWESRQVKVVSNWLRVCIKRGLSESLLERISRAPGCYPDFRMNLIMIMGIEGISPLIFQDRNMDAYKKVLTDFRTQLGRGMCRNSVHAGDHLWYKRPRNAPSELFPLSIFNYEPYQVVGGDTGPRDVWLCLLPFTRERTSWHRMRRLIGVDYLGRTKLEMALFWDRESIDRRFQLSGVPCFPTHEEMLAESKITHLEA
ncbi:hypothetical protein F4810DRAFT_407423 [Camillea tinctor]|nr:hypothetical protein F4810DRAFT_407423 [Camillea tinctor]